MKIETGIIKQPDNLYRATYSKRHPKTKKTFRATRRNIKTITLAKKIRLELVLQVERKIEESVTPTFGICLEEYLLEITKRDYASSTIKNMSACLRKHTKSWIDVRLDHISGDEFRKLIKERVGSRSVHQQKNIHKYLKGLFEYALEKGYIIRNPTPKMNFKAPRNAKEVLTKSESVFFLRKASEHRSKWYPIWATALYTGMRSSELYSLTWDKVDFENERILVNASWDKTKVDFKSTKSGYDRYVEIAPQLLSLLKELKLRSKSNQFVLPRLTEWKRGDQAKELQKFLLSFDLPKIRFHDLRATWATILLSKGTPPVQVMKMGGWRELKTMQYYIRLSGIDTKGVLSDFDLHDPNEEMGKVIQLRK